MPGGRANTLSSGFSGSNVTYWRIRRNTTYDDGTLVVPNLTQSSISVPLVSPGTEYLERYTLLDISLSRAFETDNGAVLRPQFDLFNLANASRSLRFAPRSTVPRPTGSPRARCRGGWFASRCRSTSRGL